MSNSSIQEGRLSEIYFRSGQCEDIRECLHLEESMSEKSEDAGQAGFLLSGGQGEQAYVQAIQGRTFWVAQSKKGGNVIAFLFALSPESPIVKSLASHSDKFQINAGCRNPFEVSAANTAWLAKVAVHRAFRRLGVSKMLYEKLFVEYPTWNFVTTTVISPIENAPSRHLQEKMGFKEIGEWDIGPRGDFPSVRCRLHVFSCFLENC